MDFRDPRTIDALLSDPRNYNVFFVSSHGSLAKNEDGGQFPPEPNTILIYTGAGRPGYSVFTNKRMEKEWMNLFDPGVIKQTFAAFLGLYEGHTDLLYKVPNEPCPEIFLSIGEQDVAKNVAFWGVFKHTGENHGRRNFSNLEEVPELTKTLYEGTFASVMVRTIGKLYAKQGKTNIIFFVSCRNAHKLGARSSNYSESAAPFFSPSHFMTKYVPSGLNAHIPKEAVEPFHRKRIFLLIEDQRLPLDPEERNMTVTELISMLQTKYGVFPALPDSLYLSDERMPYQPLEKDVLVESQLTEELFADGTYQLRVYPSYAADRPVPVPHNPLFVDPEHLETAEIVRRGKAMNTPLGKKRKTRKTRKTLNR